MKILVTGANGFAGGHLLPILKTDFPGAAILASGFDVTDREAILKYFAAEKPDLCLHLAGIAAIADAVADPAQAWAVNLHGPLNIADAIQAHAPACRLIFISSAEVYGGSFKTGLPLDETALLAPVNLYAATKAAAELALGARAAQGLKLLRLRPFNHTGPGQSEAFVAPAFAAQIARIESGNMPPVIKVGSLDSARDFLDVRDVCAAYSLAVRRFDALPNNAVINIASGSAVKIGAILDMLLAQARCKITAEQDPARLRKTEIPRAMGDAGYALKMLAWKAKIGLDETLQTVLDAARKALD